MKDITYKSKRNYADVVSGIQNRGFTLLSYGDRYNSSVLDCNGRVKIQKCYAIYINRNSKKAITLDYFMERDYSQRDTLVATNCISKEDYTDCIDWSRV